MPRSRSATPARYGRRASGPLVLSRPGEDMVPLRPGLFRQRSESPLRSHSLIQAGREPGLQVPLWRRATASLARRSTMRRGTDTITIAASAESAVVEGSERLKTRRPIGTIHNTTTAAPIEVIRTHLARLSGRATRATLHSPTATSVRVAADRASGKVAFAGPLATR